MIRTIALAIGLIALASGSASAQSNFDATGQFVLGFSFGVPGQDDARPTLGFRLGSSNVPLHYVERNSAPETSLSLKSETKDANLGTFSGIQFGFDRADPTFRMIDDLFSGDDADQANAIPTRQPSRIGGQNSRSLGSDAVSALGYLTAPQPDYDKLGD